MAGFTIDLTALSDTTQAILDVMDHMATRRVSELAPEPSTVGHEQLHRTFADFCRRWDVGVDNLQRDVATLADRLAECLGTYAATDEARAAGFRGVIERPTGSDPAVTQ